MFNTNTMKCRVHNLLTGVSSESETRRGNWFGVTCYDALWYLGWSYVHSHRHTSSNMITAACQSQTSPCHKREHVLLLTRQ